jgi:hypothetical protein
MRDVEIAIGAFALSQLSALRGHYAAERQGSTGAPGSSFVVNPYCVSIQNSDGGYMRKLASILVLLALSAMPVLAGVQNFNNVSLVDVNCSKKVTADPYAHTRSCALKCAASGFGIITNDKQFLKFDAEGNAKIVEALKASEKKDHLRVDVSGDVQGDTLKVVSAKLL